MNKQYAKTGTFAVADPAAAETIVVGFQPSYVRAVSIENATTYEYFAGMSAGTCIDTAAAVVVNAAGGITLTANGFTLGLDICDTAGDTVYWMAIR